MKRTKPLIGVTGPDRGGNTAWSFIAFALRTSGARAVRITPSRPHPQRLDGVILSGGSDIDPALYGARPHAATSHLDHERDRMERTLLERILPLEIPIMGICRGAQMINIHLGGSLNQHIFDEDLPFEHKRTPLPYKRIFIEPHTRLYATMQRREAIVNSIHHQSIKRLGSGLIRSAYDENGILQAMEHTKHPFVLGLQWHPEYLPQKPEQRALFRALVEHAKRAGRSS